MTTIALAGNPNAGKTTLFNALTGARQHVGNYPGITVDIKSGIYSHNQNKMDVVDLPGIYSLTAYSEEEVVARDFLVNQKPAMIINIVDAANLERNLYLTVQLMELGLPVCIALNMMDVARTRGIGIDVARLAALLQVPVIPTVARHGQGKLELMGAVAAAVERSYPVEPLQISYSDDVDLVLQEMQAVIEKHHFLTQWYPARWIALKYLENDARVMARGRQVSTDVAKRLEGQVEALARHLHETLDTYPEALVADYRYGFISSILKQGVLTRQHNHARLYTSDKIDRVVTNRFMGPLFMLAVIWGLYQFTFTYSDFFVQLLERFFDGLGELASSHLPDGLLQSLVVSGIIDGVGGVLGFVPLILFMFLGIAIIEDSGYLARVAFMLDRIFSFFGLHGGSVLPFIVSGGIAGGCAVPGIMATRTLKSPRERLATLLTVPFMNCGAKLPILALLIGTFFAAQQALFMFGFTLVAWTGALLVAKLLRVTIIRGPATPFVMELPPYRFPTFKGLAIHTWERTWQYIKKAGTIILAISIVLWTLMTFPQLPTDQIAVFDQQRQKLQSSASPVSQDFEEDQSTTEEELEEHLLQIDGRQAQAALQYSIAGRIGLALEPITRWAGFDWRTNIALIGGFAAKEVVVSTLGTAYSLGEVDPETGGSLKKILAAAEDWSPLKALALVIFVMFYAPCFVSVVCIMRETHTWKWGVFSMIFNTLLAYGLAVGIYQTGSLLNLG